MPAANHSNNNNASEYDSPIKEEYGESSWTEDIESEKPLVNNIETEIMQRNISESFRALTRVLHNREEDDECDLYAKLLAKKLRRYPDDVRLKLMYSIDGIMVENPYPEGDEIS